MTETSKIKNSIIFLAVFTILVFAPVIRAEATYTYIGIKIEEAIRLLTLEDICLNPTTKMSITSSDGVTTYDAVTLTVGVCPDDGDVDIAEHQIWSNLVDLTSGTTYNIKLEVPICWTYWHKDTPCVYNNYSSVYKCWYAGTSQFEGVNENCTEICADHGLTLATYGATVWDENAGALKALTGATCSSSYYINDCTWGATAHRTGSDCYACRNCAIAGDCAQDSASKSVNYKRVCVCNHPTGLYNFPFTFVAL